MVKDPVCGMYIDIYGDPPKAEYHGMTYHFCGSEHRQLFEQNPEEYVKDGHKRVEPER
jgi:YHS domain-containing protein